MKGILLILICSTILVSCFNTKTFVLNDKNYNSQFIIYKNKFNYKEENKSNKIDVYGKYEIKDSTIYFYYREDKPLPISYVNGHHQILKNKTDSIKIIVSDLETQKPVIFATIAIYNSNEKLIKGFDTNAKGIRTFSKNGQYKKIIISNLYYGTYELEIEGNISSTIKIYIKKNEITNAFEYDFNSGKSLADYILDYEYNLTDSEPYLKRNNFYYKIKRKKD